MGVGAGEGGQVAPGDPAVGLRTQAGKHAGVGQAVQRVDLARSAGAELWLQRHARHVRGCQRQVDDRADLVVVDAHRDRHRQRREDPGVRQRLHGLGLDPSQVRTAVVAVPLEVEAVVLQVDLDAVAVPSEGLQHAGLAPGDRQAVGVDQHPHDVAFQQPVEQLAEPRVQRRLAAGQHDHVQPPVLARQPLVDVGQHLLHRHEAVDVRSGPGEAGGARQVAGVGQVLQQDAGVLGLQLAEPLQVPRRRRGEVARCVGDVHLRRGRPPLQPVEDLGVLVVQRDDPPVVGAAADQPHPAVGLRQVAGQPPGTVDGPAVTVVAAGAPRRHVPADPVGPRGHALPRDAVGRVIAHDPTSTATGSGNEGGRSSPDRHVRTSRQASNGSVTSRNTCDPDSGPTRSGLARSHSLANRNAP